MFSGRRLVRKEHSETQSGTTIGYHYCYNCGRPRSKSYHLNNRANADHVLPGVCRRCLPSSTTGPVVRVTVEGGRTQHHIPHGTTVSPQHRTTSSDAGSDEDIPQVPRSSRDSSNIDTRPRSIEPYRAGTLVQRNAPARSTREDRSDVMKCEHASRTNLNPSILVHRGRNVHDDQISTRAIG